MAGTIVRRSCAITAAVRRLRPDGARSGGAWSAVAAAASSSVGSVVAAAVVSPAVTAAVVETDGDAPRVGIPLRKKSTVKATIASSSASCSPPLLRTTTAVGEEEEEAWRCWLDRRPLRELILSSLHISAAFAASSTSSSSSADFAVLSASSIPSFLLTEANARRPTPRLDWRPSTTSAPRRDEEEKGKGPPPPPPILRATRPPFSSAFSCA